MQAMMLACAFKIWPRQAQHMIICHDGDEYQRLYGVTSLSIANLESAVWRRGIVVIASIHLPEC